MMAVYWFTHTLQRTISKRELLIFIVSEDICKNERSFILFVSGLRIFWKVLIYPNRFYNLPVSIYINRLEHKIRRPSIIIGFAYRLKLTFAYLNMNETSIIMKGCLWSWFETILAKHWALWTKLEFGDSVVQRNNITWQVKTIFFYLVRYYLPQNTLFSRVCYVMYIQCSSNVLLFNMSCF